MCTLQKCFLTLVLVIIGITGFSQSYSYQRNLKWFPVSVTRFSPKDSLKELSFEGSVNSIGPARELPGYLERFPMQFLDFKVTGVSIDKSVYVPLSNEENAAIRNKSVIPDSIQVNSSVSYQRKAPFLNISFLPFRKNPSSGIIEKLVSFTLMFSISESSNPGQVKSTRVYADHSVLADGKWVKMGVTATGIYRLNYADLQAMGFNPDAINPANIRIYGNNGGMLPEANSKPRIDDLRENSIYVAGESDGKFDAGDYILFYAKGPDSWVNSGTDQYFHHVRNLYSDVNYYFITMDKGPGKRVGSQPSLTQTPDFIITKFNDFAFYEKNNLNLIKSGREWYDQDIFELTTTRNYSFTFADLDLTSPVVIRTDFAARSTNYSTNFVVNANGQQVMSVAIPPTTADYLDQYAKEKITDGNYTSSSPVIDVRVTYNKNGDESTGYLNYLELNVLRMLKLSGGQMAFRSVASIGKNKTSEFQLAGNGQQVTVWDVSEPGDIKAMGTEQTSSRTVFRLLTDTLHEFVAFDGSSFNSIQSYAAVANQDLHGTGGSDYVIITHPDFMSQAQQLKEFHVLHNNLNVLITSPEVIYNEFSSGSPDISAIRDFMKMLYDRAAPGQEPKYLLLFGDASYDYKNRITSNTNFIPAYESAESLDPVETYVTDDFFGLLDDSEGLNCTGDLDIGIGRFPVTTVEQAQSAIDKINHYASQSDSVKNDWRNVVCFVCDDEDSNLHMNQGEEITGYIGSNYPVYNIDKIYLDAYQQQSTPGGARYPDVNVAINQRVNKGALIINYIGHGGELGWAHERVLEIPDIKAWSNFNNMPVFVTATCEFSRYDDPTFVCAGEWVFLNQNGGGIALFTTTRPTFAGSNFSLTSNFYHHVFNRTAGDYPKMGDLIVISKNATGASANTRKFVLLGDPGLELVYPNRNVVTTAINNQVVTAEADTLQALENVSITGEVQDAGGNKLTSFSGTVFPTVFDKPAIVHTLANDGGVPLTYTLQKNIIYKGAVDVTNGDFSFSFIVPKDIAYQFGKGKISYYARSADDDANGYDTSIVIGGYNAQAHVDDAGPMIRMYMNDTSFRNGGMTDQNPKLFAIVTDTSGINTVGNGIGHDITAVLDDNNKDLSILNDYYIADKNTFTRGIVKYPFSSLSDGMHTVKLKVWDVYNNSSEASLSFLVVSSAEFALNHLFTYPNPFSDHTTFSFEYNQPASGMNINIRIFTSSGQLVKTIEQKINSDSYRANEIRWDGTDEKGAKISTGMYVYLVTAGIDGIGTIQKSSKLVFVK